MPRRKTKPSDPPVVKALAMRGSLERDGTESHDNAKKNRSYVQRRIAEMAEAYRKEWCR